MSAISSIGFTAGGIDVNQIVTDLMTAERAPESVMSTKQAAIKLQSSTLASLKASLVSLQSRASALISSGLSTMSTSVSSASASATIGGSATPGSLTFTIDSLAAASGMRTASTVATSSSVITTNASLAISSTASKLGITAMRVGPGTTAGQYTVTVTQATTGATATGTAPLAASTVIDGSNNVLDLQIDGVSRTVTLAAGTYTAAQLVGATQTAIDASGGGATASLASGGGLVLTTKHEGSSATLQVVGGTASTALQLAAGSTTGTDGALQIGSNPSVTVTSAGNGSPVTVSTGVGSLDLQLGGGLRVGSSTVAVVSTGDRSLSAVSAAINAANVGVTASAVNVANNAWLLQINSTAAGVANSLSLDSSAFSSAGGLLQTSAAQDAKITIGAGTGAYSVTSSTNSFTNVLPGVTINAASLSATPVTVTVGRNDSATADAVGALISAATTLIASVKVNTAYNTATNKASPLTTNTAVRSMADQIRSAVTAIVGSGPMSLGGLAGITIKQDGTLNFDRSAFIAALDSNPAGVERLFGRGGTTNPAGASWAAATDNTAAGSYGVVVTTAATRATTGDVLVGGSPAGQTIGVRIGATTATYHALAGATAADIVTGLNAALANAGLKVNAEVNGGGVRLTAAGFGGAGSFESNLDVGGAGTWATNAGTDVAGTIDGKAAIGVGNRLSLLDGATSPARGLGIDVAEGVSGNLGPIEYAPGIAARLVALGTTLTSANGALTTSATTYDARSAEYDNQIAAFEVRMTAKEAQYRKQWTTVQSALANLQNQGTWLASQVTGL
ncbi:MAG: flagellar hook-associated 2 domain protein, partial [Ilumatobacteraceae bacterium]|nr:flagellar hook-associated 2 domain protein [Ilumatobacteraceae bacterium]